MDPTTSWKRTDAKVWRIFSQQFSNRAALDATEGAFGFGNQHVLIANFIVLRFSHPYSHDHLGGHLVHLFSCTTSIGVLCKGESIFFWALGIFLLL